MGDSDAPDGKDGMVGIEMTISYENPMRKFRNKSEIDPTKDWNDESQVDSEDAYHTYGAKSRASILKNRSLSSNKILQQNVYSIEHIDDRKRVSRWMMHNMNTGSEEALFQIQVKSSAKPVAGEGMLLWFEEGSNVDLDEEQARNKSAEKPYINLHQESHDNIIEHGHRLNGEEIRHFRSEKQRVTYENLLSGTPGKDLPTAKDPLFIPATCCVMEFSTRGGTGAHFCLNACYTSEIPIIFNTSKNRRLLRWICNVLEYLVKLLLCVLEEETSQKRAFAIYCKFNVSSLQFAFIASNFPHCSRELLNYLFSTTLVVVSTVKAFDEAIEVYEGSVKRRKATKKLQILRDKEAWLKLFHDAVCCVCQMPCYRRRCSPESKKADSTGPNARKISTEIRTSEAEEAEEAKRRHEAWLKAQRKVEEEKAAAAVAEERTRTEAAEAVAEAAEAEARARAEAEAAAAAAAAEAVAAAEASRLQAEADAAAEAARLKEEEEPPMEPPDEPPEDDADGHAGWHATQDKEGKVYYYNEFTNETSWECPWHD